MVHKTLTLDHDLYPGWLAPWVDAVFEAQVLAHRCASCSRVSFMPLRQCDCGKSQGSWIALPGNASLVLQTSGSDGEFALVQFEGADTRTIVRLQNWTAGVIQGRLLAPTGNLPELLLTPLGNGKNDGDAGQ